MGILIKSVINVEKSEKKMIFKCKMDYLYKNKEIGIKVFNNDEFFTGYIYLPLYHIENAVSRFVEREGLEMPRCPEDIFKNIITGDAEIDAVLQSLPDYCNLESRMDLEMALSAYTSDESFI
ncbi:hypothetical protein NDS46_31850 (plasmid) [Paenibacillus thiaminolyticus]|uniref:hypothetical protein n=1 Tax=Paenibacillus thiaminolyticus TaxID=49283 RepID=UPI00232D25BC|nr:hypothetical protein [Paenibacillus thiaminolyticus]WCF11553.1 hypothetical protein NDS46_31850 [Paenibacillus thiaminolyticus]